MTEFLLRDVVKADLPALHAYHSEPESIELSGVDRRDKAAWEARWVEIMPDPRVIKKAIVVDGEVAGYIVLFDRDGRRELGYWLGKRFWGRGLATQAVAGFLKQTAERPLWARISKRNPASATVAQKCGFVTVSEELFPTKDGPPSPGWLLRLDARGARD